MADCSELAVLINKLTENIAAQGNVKTLDDVVEKLKEILPQYPITRQFVSEMIHEATTRQNKQVDEDVKLINNIKREARSNVNLQESASRLQEYLDEGEVPPKRDQKKPTEPIQELRDVIYELRKEINRSAPARKARLEKSIQDLERRLKSGDILPKVRPEPVTNEEIERLVFERDMIRKEIQDEIRAVKPLTVWGKVGVGIDTARLIMTSGEFSFALRQGGVYAFSHPLKWTKSLGESIKAFASPRALYNLNKRIQNRENAPKYLSSGLVLLHEGMSLTKAEEVIMNYWMDKLPVFRNFNRAAIAFFNQTRTDMFDMGYQTLGKNGEMTQSEMEIWANYINVMTGRGKLSIGNLSLEAAALPLNRTFFSARYVASRFQFLGGTVKSPLLSIAGENKRAYRMIAKEYIRFGMGLATVLGIGLLVGADVEDDPRSTDFGKLKFGNKRLDPLMGFGQTLTYLSRILTGSTKTSRGNIYAIRPTNVFFVNNETFQKKAETRYGGQTTMDVMGRFLRSKLSPQFGLAMNIATGQTYLGEDITLLNTTSQFLYPMAYGDIFDVMQEEGIPENVSLSILTLLGMGLQTYDNDKSYAKNQSSRRGI